MNNFFFTKIRKWNYFDPGLWFKIMKTFLDVKSCTRAKYHNENNCRNINMNLIHKMSQKIQQKYKIQEKHIDYDNKVKK